MTDDVEFHFQEFFRDHEVQILVDGHEVARFEARTRPQVGLAHVERVAARDGARVTVRVAGEGEQSVAMGGGVRQWLVRLEEGVLSITPASRSPRYL